MTARKKASSNPALADMSHALRNFSGNLHRRLRQEVNMGDFTWAQIDVIKHLEAYGATTVSALARAKAMRPQSMSAIVAVLEAEKLVVGKPDPEDGRQTLLTLTHLSREKIRFARTTCDDWLSQNIVDKLSADEQRQLEAAIGLLKKIAD